MSAKSEAKTAEQLAAAVRRENGKVVIPGLEKLRIGAGERECTLIASLAAAMQAIGQPYSYEDLMGLSGAAFRIQVCQPNWCPSSPHASCGFSCEKVATDLLPCEFTYHWIDKDAGKFARACSTAVAGIDRGIPAMISSEETGIITGYEDGGKTLLGRPPYAPPNGYVPLKHVQWLVNSKVADSDAFTPWVIWTLKPGKAVPSRKETLVASLKRAMMLANTERFGGAAGKPGYYASGFAAWNVWIAQLRDEKRFEQMKAADLKTAMEANGVIYYGLLDARASAAIFLRTIAGEAGVFGAKPAGHLRAAAEFYQSLAGTLSQRCPTEVAPLPHMLKAGQTWTSQMRNAQADILQKALVLERQALGEIEKSLTTKGLQEL